MLLEHQWDTRLSPGVQLFCSYHILMSAVITEQTHGNLESVFFKGLGHAILGNFSFDQVDIGLTEITN